MFELDTFEQREEIEKYETELIAKDNLLEECYRKIEEMNKKMKRLEAENHVLLTQKGQEELNELQMKKQSMSLNLKNTTATSDVQTDTMGLPNVLSTTETETCGTFHTANSDCSFASALPSPFPPRAEHRTPLSTGSPPDDGTNALMSDSGVCLDTKTHEPPTSVYVHPLAKHRLEGDNLSTNSSQNFYEQLLQSQMGKLRDEIAVRKAKIMKILESGGEKATLNAMINELQELQKDYVKLEMRFETSRGRNYNCHKIYNFKLILTQMVAFRKAKCLQNYVEAQATVTRRVIIR